MGSQRVRHDWVTFTFFHFAPFVLEFIFHTCDSSFFSPGAWSPCDLESMPHQRTCLELSQVWKMNSKGSSLAPARLRHSCSWMSFGHQAGSCSRWVRALQFHLVTWSQHWVLLILTPGFVWVMGSLSPSTSPCTLGDLATLFFFLHTQPDGARTCEAVFWSTALALPLVTAPPVHMPWSAWPAESKGLLRIYSLFRTWLSNFLKNRHSRAQCWATYFWIVT